MSGKARQNRKSTRRQKSRARNTSRSKETSPRKANKSNWQELAESRAAGELLRKYAQLQLDFDQRDFAAVRQAAQELLDNPETPGHLDLAEIYLLKGMAEYESHDLSSAKSSLELAIGERPDYATPYIELSRCCHARGDVEGERRVLTDGLIRCAEKTELQMLAEKFLGDETISLCMIVKNEEEFLPRCLASVTDVVDEIIVVDTGSEDRTVEIAESFGAKIYHHPWQNSFSLHRNQSLEYATCDWVLILDADEELERVDIEKLKTATRIPDINVVSVSVLNKNLKTGELTSFLPSMRLWRRRLGCHYESIVHNELRIPDTEPVLRADVRVYHYGYSLDWDKQKQKVERTRALLEQQLAADPDNAFANFNYAQLLRGESQRPDETTCNLILEHAGRAVDNTDPQTRTQRYLHVSALEQMSAAYFYLQRFADAERCLRRALDIDPDYIDARYDLGHIFAARGDLEQAIAAYTDYIDFANNFQRADEADSYILQHTNRQPEAYYALGLISERKGDAQAALHHFSKVLEYKDDHLDLHEHLARLYLNLGQFGEARSHVERSLTAEPGNFAARYLKAEIELRSGEYNRAESLLLELLQAQPENPRLLNDLGNCFLKQQDFEKAERYYDQALVADPHFAVAMRNLGICLIHQERHREALGYFNRYLKLQPEDHQILTLAGRICAASGDQRQAINLYERALRLEPDSAETLTAVADSYCELGHLESAYLGYQRALTLEPQCERARQMIAELKQLSEQAQEMEEARG